MNDRSQSLPVVVAGGGIGGLAAALALTRQGFAVKVLEQSPKLGEIGAGIQLGPNAFAAFDALGVGPNARARAVYTDDMVMHDALDESLVARVPVGDEEGHDRDARHRDVADRRGVDVEPDDDRDDPLVEGGRKALRLDKRDQDDRPGNPRDALSQRKRH